MRYKKSLKLIMISTLLFLPIFSASCIPFFYSSNSSSSEENNQKENNQKVQPTTNTNNNIDNLEADESDLLWNPPKNVEKDGGVAKVWKYVLQIPNVIEKKYPNLTSLQLQPEIIKHFEWIFGQIKAPYDTSKEAPAWPDIFTVYNNYLSKYLPTVERREMANKFLVNSTRLFPEDLQYSIQSQNFPDELTYLISLSEFTTVNLTKIQLSFLLEYIKMQTFLYSNINDYSKTLEQQLFSNKQFINLLKELVSLSELFLEPLSHISLDKHQVIISNQTAKNTDFKAFYDWLIEINNKWISPLLIYTGNEKSILTLSKIKNNEYIPKYFYPLMQNRIKNNFSKQEVDELVDDFIASNSRQKNWKFKPLNS